MTSLEEEGGNATGQKIKELYFDILNCKGNTRAYEEAEFAQEERKHTKKLNKRRAKELRKQQKKLKAQEKKFMQGDEDASGDEVPFFLQDASIRAAMRERAAEEAAAAKAAKRKREESSSDG